VAAAPEGIRRARGGKAESEGEEPLVHVSYASAAGVNKQ
jgi:hypothetical protein